MAETQTTTPNTQAAESPAQEQLTADQAAAGNEAGKESPKPDLDAIVQRAVDRATNKLGNENKKLREKIEKLEKAGMDAEELKNFELSEKEKEIAERERALTEKENRLIAIKVLGEVGMYDGSETALSLVDFVMADDEDGIRERVKTLNALVEKIVKGKVDGVFKANGRTPGVGTDATGGSVKNTDSLAVRMGKNTAQANQQSRKTLDHYLGGK